jgi:Ca2+-binding RTX toxin-like protein
MPTIVGTPSENGDKIKITLDALDPLPPFTRDISGRPLLDTLAGDDLVTIYGSGNLSLLTGTGNDKVQNFATGTLILKLGAGDDTFVSSTSETAYSIDTVSAGPGNDIVSTGYGSDWLFGGTGNDTLTGGAGDDTFFYPFIISRDGGTPEGAIVDIKSHCEIDTITDFQLGFDDLSFGPEQLSLGQFKLWFDLSGYDSDGDGVNDSSSLTLTSDPTFAINLQGLQTTEAELYNQSITWAI